MRRTWLLAVVAALMSACAPRRAPEGPAPPGLPRALSVRIGDGLEARTLRVDLEAYVRAALVAELAPDPDADASATLLETQAIVARTFAVAHVGRHLAEGFDLCATTHCQVVDFARAARGDRAEAAARAARATEGVILWHAGRPARVVFHADCGGARSAAVDVWGGRDDPYLRGGPDPLPAAARHSEWTFTADRERLRRALADDARTSPGRRLDALVVHARDAAGRAQLVAIAGERTPIVRGEELRRAIVRAFGPQSLRSTLFEVSRRGDRFVFTGRGYGHGVGLCQVGARARARAGASVREILLFYYPGTTLGRLPR
ncbi:MAG TPA: SpoIID/LytB domain-containing protein [Vicinamibacterales bacterium]|nr:SpoIID/LytB domain-containing protein [Vicinamibacterales bacterium]